MPKIDYRNVEKAPDRCGGRAVIAGTRIRVSLVHSLHDEGKTVAEIVQLYPHLKTADVYDALAYALDHADEMAVDLAADNEDVAQAKWPGGRTTV